MRPGGDSLTLRCSQWTDVFLDEGVICCKHGGVGVCARGGGAGRARNEGARVVLVAGVGVAAVGLRALYVSPAPPTVLSPPQTRILPCGNSSSTTRLIPRGVSGCPQGGSSAVPGELFYPPFGASLLWLRRECWALRGACAAAVVALDVAGLQRLTFRDHWEKGCRDEHCRSHVVLEKFIFWNPAPWPETVINFAAGMPECRKSHVLDLPRKQSEWIFSTLLGGVAPGCYASPAALQSAPGAGAECAVVERALLGGRVRRGAPRALRSSPRSTSARRGGLRGRRLGTSLRLVPLAGQRLPANLASPLAAAAEHDTAGAR